MSGDCDRQSEVSRLDVPADAAAQAAAAQRPVASQSRVNDPTALSDDSALAEQIALFAAGAMTATDAAHFELLISSDDRALIELPLALDRLAPVINALAAQMPAVLPPTHVREQLLARIASEPVSVQESSPPTVRQSNNADWNEVEPGQFMRVLNIDRRQKRFTALVRLSAGAVCAGHHHSATEECYVLAGSLQVGSQRLVAGDYQCSAAGTWHEEQRTDDGCVCLIIAPIDQLLSQRR